MLFDQIASNKRRTWLLLIAFFGLLALLGAAIGYLWLRSAVGGVLLALIIGAIYSVYRSGHGYERSSRGL